MARTSLNPTSINMPDYGYDQGVLITSPTKFARLAGQIGVARDGSIPADFKSQAELAWDNVEAVLTEAGMTIADICKVVVYIVGAENLGTYVEVHNRRTAGCRPPWTEVTLPANPDAHHLVEVDVEAMC